MRFLHFSRTWRQLLGDYRLLRSQVDFPLDCETDLYLRFLLCWNDRLFCGFLLFPLRSLGLFFHLFCGFYYGRRFRSRRLCKMGRRLLSERRCLFGSWLCGDGLFLSDLDRCGWFNVLLRFPLSPFSTFPYLLDLTLVLFSNVLILFEMSKDLSQHVAIDARHVIFYLISFLPKKLY